MDGDYHNGVKLSKGMIFFLTWKTKTTLNVMLKEAFCMEKGWPMNFHSSTLSSNLRSIIRELGAKISARVVGGSSLWRGVT